LDASVAALRDFEKQCVAYKQWMTSTTGGGSGSGGGGGGGGDGGGGGYDGAIGGGGDGGGSGVGDEVTVVISELDTYGRPRTLAGSVDDDARRAAAAALQAAPKASYARKRKGTDLVAGDGMLHNSLSLSFFFFFISFFLLSVYRRLRRRRMRGNERALTLLQETVCCTSALPLYMIYCISFFSLSV
jgi:hypothetical protein